MLHQLANYLASLAHFVTAIYKLINCGTSVVAVAQANKNPIYSVCVRRILLQ